MSIDVINPATNELVKRYETWNQEQLESALNETAAVQREWQKTSFSERQALMLKAAEEMRNNIDEYAMIITREMGKPLTQAQGEIKKCAWLCEHYAEQTEAYLKPELIETENTKSYRCFEPLGVIFAIMPWNFPFWQVMRFAVPNLMGGNAGVLKHAPNCLGAGEGVQQIFERAGFPKGLFRNLIIDVDLAGEVIEHSAIRGVTLTGSERAGSAVASQAGKALKKVVMELGGSDPYLILEDADLDLAVKQCVTSRLNNAGQVCIAAKRILVVESLYDEFVGKVKDHMAGYKLGDPTDPDTTMGPMARDDLRKQLHEQVERSIAAGAECVMGGEMPDDEGFFYPATLFLDVKPDNPAFKEELFGPVVCISKIKDEAEGIRLANDNPYGLGAAVFTQDIERGERIAREELHAGTCNVNSFVGSDPRLPFGGIKRSGFGRELASEGAREFMNTKTVVVA